VSGFSSKNREVLAWEKPKLSSQKSLILSAPEISLPLGGMMMAVNNYFSHQIVLTRYGHLDVGLGWIASNFYILNHDGDLGT
jgi:hypothetical protein